MEEHSPGGTVCCDLTRGPVFLSRLVPGRVSREPADSPTLWYSTASVGPQAPSTARGLGLLHRQGRRASPRPRTRPHSDASCRVAWLCPELGAPVPQSVGQRVLWRVFCSNPSLTYS